MGHKKEAKRVQVTFTDEQWTLIEKLRGEMGNADADVVRTIVVAWLSEKSLVSTAAKEKPRRSTGQ